MFDRPSPPSLSLFIIISYIIIIVLLISFNDYLSFTQKLALDVLDFVYQISIALEVRDYPKAEDLYLRLSIGNAAWPLGVTAV